ncbi:NACHT, LRR and PYD domains-containing protein 10 [Erinaceus europaeus]|uniref:NACHT, LRR and PYD domains-containing protein 10 n=1 Tax=Erinaceus europaeus TaxID=9365 RepID=A0ABM3W5E6_ERIEU|nr:NACHT, LRR and PYD domains-containing protein 10 [Erinaceus europaeus]
MAAALAHNPREALLWALSDLEENNFKVFKFHLRDQSLFGGQFQLARGELEGLNRVDLASRLISICGAQEAVKVVLKVLKIMNLMELVDQLSHVCLNDYRHIYREYVRCLLERWEGGVHKKYNQLLLVTKPSSGSPVSPVGAALEQESDSDTVKALFDPAAEASQHPPLVVLQGSAGMGKTTLVRKMVQDWAAGTLYQGQFDYVFYVSCREVVLLPEGKLKQLLFWCCGDNQAPVNEIVRQPERLLFLLDGFDELQRPFAVGLQKLGQSPMERLLTCLMKREVLPTCSLLVTTRPLALQNLESLLKKPRHIHVLGFSKKEREKYFSIYFTDKEQARNAFAIVQGSDVLYKACQVPGICWVVCSWLKGQMERGSEISEMPGNDTDIFMAYVSTFLPPSGNEGCPEASRDKVLQGLCSLAAEGIQQQQFLFKEEDVRKHGLDGPSLPHFLNSSDYYEGLDTKKFYSFRHIIFQEFFHAISYLVKKDKDQMGKGSCREVSRLLDEKEEAGGEEMTLSMHFLLDISKKESSSNLELKFCFKISPSIKQDLKYFREQMESIKHNRTWDLEFSLYDSMLKKLRKGVQMSDLSFTVGHSNDKRAQSSSSFNVQIGLNDGQKEEVKRSFMGKGKIAGSQKETSSREKAEGHSDWTKDKEARNNRVENRNRSKSELNGQKDVTMQFCVELSSIK